MQHKQFFNLKLIIIIVHSKRTSQSPHTVYNHDQGPWAINLTSIKTSQNRTIPVDETPKHFTTIQVNKLLRPRKKQGAVNKPKDRTLYTIIISFYFSPYIDSMQLIFFLPFFFLLSLCFFQQDKENKLRNAMPKET